jgi:hypothetical protein
VPLDPDGKRLEGKTRNRRWDRYFGDDGADEDW